MTWECFSQTGKFSCHLPGDLGLGVKSDSVTDHGLSTSLILLERPGSFEILQLFSKTLSIISDVIIKTSCSA